MLMTWVAAQELTEHELTEDHTYAVGVLLGQLHLCTAGFPQRRPGIYTVARIRERLQRLQLDPRAVAAVGPLLTELTAEAQELVTTRNRNLPSGIGHSDLFPDNLLFASPRIVRAAREERRRPLGELGPLGFILDLEQAATIPYIYDVAVALLSFCAPLPTGEAPAEAAPPTVGPLHCARAQALLAGYQTMRVLGEADWRALPTELRWAAVRFTTTRLTDVERYGRLVGPTAFGHSPEKISPPAPDAALPAPAPADAPPARPRSRQSPVPGPTHAKDYRDFARRLALLRPLSADDLGQALR